jgi:hypothetical protein
VRTVGRMPCASSRRSSLPRSAASSASSTGELERHDGLHQPLLRAVVEVPHDLPASLVAGNEEARTRGDQLVAAVGVGDRRLEQLGELPDTLLATRRC